MSDGSGPRWTRRMPRFRLLTLLVIVTVICMVLGLGVQELHRVVRQRRAAAEVQSRGGRVRWGDAPEAQGVVAGWLRFFLRDEYFAEVSDVDLMLNSDDDLELLYAFPRLTSLGLAGNVTNSSLERLRDFPRLESLGLSGVDVNEQHLARVIKLPNLHQLGLVNCVLSDASLQALYDTPSLRELAIIDTDITEAEVLAVRAANPALAIFVSRPRTAGPPKPYLPSAEELPQVKELTFEGPFTTDATMAALADAHSLTRLRLDKCDITDKGLEQLSGLSQLTHLELRSITQITDRGFEHVSNLSNLTDLTVGQGPISDKGLESIGQLHNLTQLTFWGGEFTDAGMQHLRSLRKLTWLDINGPNISDNGVRELAELTQLDTLNVYNAKIQGHGFASFSPGITRLDLNGSDVTDSRLAGIAALSSLEELHLADTNITDDGVHQLGKLRSLRRLVLVDTEISDVGLGKLTGLDNLLYLFVGPHVSKSAAVKFLATSPSCQVVGSDKNGNRLFVVPERYRGPQQ